MTNETKLPVIWLSKAVVLAAHEEQLAEHGGAVGLRDDGLLESALARPKHLLSYTEPEPDIPALAASYAFGIARDHPFTDGNKRTSLVVAETFMLLNGMELEAGDAELLSTWLQLAEGEISETDLAAWLRERSVSLG
ncbi:type II toxin-antitoxin system death-on-curing family toxin [Pleomorphomonas sp. JP5]|uniref:type II toxin-antitoxin system death-on-curing family toxin n=1 Tax=Pleomorphomonas sp. JP5 TaxID=2942998 RepID=UPI002044A888|nr:type II toxin-antitoxin system death-on-curing family toxin [Pleomorphomonas sp. JP5]MCM5560329.1 type II toxin-antitoxin system death-on-curing family toxin [Pleomorphomonas sp. JP5]